MAGLWAGGADRATIAPIEAVEQRPSAEIEEASKAQ